MLTSLFHGGNTGSNPVGDAKNISILEIPADYLSKICPMYRRGLVWLPVDTRSSNYLCSLDARS